jgi:hypothetical protein
MSNLIRVRDPRYDAGGERTATYPTLQTLSGKTLVILNNGWTCMNELAAYLGEELKRRYDVAKVVSLPVPISSAGPEETIREASRVGDFAVVGLAN